MILTLRRSIIVHHSCSSISIFHRSSARAPCILPVEILVSYGLEGAAALHSWFSQKTQAIHSHLFVYTPLPATAPSLVIKITILGCVCVVERLFVD